MTLDRHAAERRRFARLLGVDGEPGSGLPIGSPSGRSGRDGDQQRQRTREYDGAHDSDRERDDVVVSASDAPADGTAFDLDFESNLDLEPERNASSDSPAE